MSAWGGVGEEELEGERQLSGEGQFSSQGLCISIVSY